MYTSDGLKNITCKVFNKGFHKFMRIITPLSKE